MGKTSLGWWSLLAVASVLTLSQSGFAFTHVVVRGETIAHIAERMYGRVELERVIVAANGLDSGGGNIIVPGMRLEIPAVGHHKVLPGETWQSVAAELLGDSSRGDVLARVNSSQPWLRPVVGRAIIIPFNLRYVASRGDNTQRVAYRFLGRRDRAWMVASYNNLKRGRLRLGEVLLIPLTDLKLTSEGRLAAMNASALVRSQGGGEARESQRRAAERLPKLFAHVRQGQYVRVVAEGEALLARGGLSRPQLAAVYEQLTVAYVALGASGLAATACASWAKHDTQRTLNPTDHSPKIIAVCIGSHHATGLTAAPDAGIKQ